MRVFGDPELRLKRKALKQARARKRRLRLRRSIKLLPNLFTLCNALFGFCAIVFAAQKNFQPAASFILLGAMMDALDGRIARLTHSTSEIGMQLDSLCDAISFCLAPAFLIYMWQLRHFGLIGFIIAALFLLAGIFRLARFNVTHQQQSNFFMGIPVTIAGCCIATILLTYSSAEVCLRSVCLSSLVSLGLAALMVSTVSFPTFKHVGKYWLLFLLFVFVGFIITFGLMHVLLLMYAAYFFYGIEEAIRRLVVRKLQPSKEQP